MVLSSLRTWDGCMAHRSQWDHTSRLCWGEMWTEAEHDGSQWKWSMRSRGLHWYVHQLKVSKKKVSDLFFQNPDSQSSRKDWDNTIMLWPFWEGSVAKTLVNILLMDRQEDKSLWWLWWLWWQRYQKMFLCWNINGLRGLQFSKLKWNRIPHVDR